MFSTLFAYRGCVAEAIGTQPAYAFFHPFFTLGSSKIEVFETFFF